MDILFFLNNALLGVALALDAFSVSLANGLADPQMRPKRIFAIAGTFAFFQWFMPMLGWVCVYYFVSAFEAFRPAVPWIALLLLLFLGVRMIVEGLRKKEEKTTAALTFGALLLQGVATSIDALSSGFTFVSSAYAFREAMVASLLIAAVTFVICVGGVLIGRKFGAVFEKKAAVLGGAILILIGVEIFVKGVFF